MLIIVLVHVDDCSIVEKTKVLIVHFKFEIANFVEVTDLGELHWILWIEMHRICEERKNLLFLHRLHIFLLKIDQEILKVIHCLLTDERRHP